MQIFFTSDTEGNCTMRTLNAGSL